MMGQFVEGTAPKDQARLAKGHTGAALDRVERLLSYVKNDPDLGPKVNRVRAKLTEALGLLEEIYRE